MVEQLQRLSHKESFIGALGRQFRVIGTMYRGSRGHLWDIMVLTPRHHFHRYSISEGKFSSSAVMRCGSTMWIVTDSSQELECEQCRDTKVEDEEKRAVLDVIGQSNRPA